MTSFNAFFALLCLLWWNRWRVAPWSPCSASCGGGIQSRRVSCERGSEEGVSEVESQRCVGTGRRPSDTRSCNLQPCARWATTPWGPVSPLDIDQKKVPAGVWHVWDDIVLASLFWSRLMLNNMPTKWNYSICISTFCNSKWCEGHSPFIIQTKVQFDLI